MWRPQVVTAQNFIPALTNILGKAGVQTDMHAMNPEDARDIAASSHGYHEWIRSSVTTTKHYTLPCSSALIA